MTEPIKMTMTPQQLATVLVLDAAMAHLQTGANQLGGFLKLEEEANILVSAIQLIGTKKREMQDGWERRVQLVPGAIVDGAVVR